MKSLKLQTLESAPDGAKENLIAVQNTFGFVPNMAATFSNSPAVLNGYVSLETAWKSSSFDAIERQIILLAVSVENKCLYCVAAHSTILKGVSIDANIIKSIRNREPINNEKLHALVGVTRELVAERGFIAESTKQRFLNAGYTEIALMEILVGVALKTISNYLDHMTPISIDAAFQAEAR